MGLAPVPKLDRNSKIMKIQRIIETQGPKMVFQINISHINIRNEAKVIGI